MVRTLVSHSICYNRTLFTNIGDHGYFFPYTTKNKLEDLAPIISKALIIEYYSAQNLVVKKGNFVSRVRVAEDDDNLIQET